jgi:hypothetical protein
MVYWGEQSAAFPLDPTKCDQCLVAGRCPGGATASACTDDTFNPSQSDFDACLASTRGLDLATTLARPQIPIDLSTFIPQIDGNSICREVSRPWVAVTLGEWMKRSGSGRRLSGTMQERLHIDARSRVLFVLYANDNLLEQDLWPSRDQFLDNLGVWRPDAVAAPDFSVWQGDSWIERQWAMVRSLRFYEMLQDRGFAAIPHVAWGDHGQMDEWARWLNANKVQRIAMDLQCLQQTRRRFLPELAAFRDALSPTPSLLVNGVTDELGLHALLGAWPEVSFTANVTVLAYKRRQIVPRRDGSTTRAIVDRADSSSLVRLEIERIEAAIDRFMQFRWASTASNGWAGDLIRYAVPRRITNRRPERSTARSGRAGRAAKAGQVEAALAANGRPG